MSGTNPANPATGSPQWPSCEPTQKGRHSPGSAQTTPSTTRDAFCGERRLEAARLAAEVDSRLLVAKVKHAVAVSRADRLLKHHEKVVDARLPGTVRPKENRQRRQIERTSVPPRLESSGSEGVEALAEPTQRGCGTWGFLPTAASKRSDWRTHWRTNVDNGLAARPWLVSKTLTGR